MKRYIKPTAEAVDLYVVDDMAFDVHRSNDEVDEMDTRRMDWEDDWDEKKNSNYWNDK